MPYITKELKTIDYCSSEVICHSENIVKLGNFIYPDHITFFNLSVFEITDEMLMNDFMKIYKFKCLNGPENLKEEFLKTVFDKYPEMEMKIEYCCAQFWEKMKKLISKMEERFGDISSESDVIITKKLCEIMQSLNKKQ